MRGDAYTHLQVDRGRVDREIGRTRRGGMPGALLSVVAVAVCVGGVLVWTLAAHDPYWRLFKTESLPAPGYETPEEIRAALASAAVGTPTSDSTAVRPEAVAGPARQLGAPDPAFAMLSPRPADPVIAVPSIFALGSGASQQQADLAWATAPAAADAATLEPAFGPALPRLMAQAEGPGAGPGHVVAALERVAVPEAPGPLRMRADEASEESLALARAERIRIQRRLALAGFDPRGFDGVFGPHTRTAIADFQAAADFPSTGYLDAGILADLRARTEDAYTAHLASAAREARTAPRHAPVASAREVARADRAGGCARDASGRIIAHQSFGCDVRGLAEKVTSLGRDRLPHEADGAMALNGVSSFGATPGARR